MTFEERRQARREARMMDKAAATADTTAAYYGASSRCVSFVKWKPISDKFGKARAMPL